MKITSKIVLFIVLISVSIISLLGFALISSITEEESEYSFAGMNLSNEVLKYRGEVEKYCSEFGVSDYVDYILAIMQVESGGLGNDVMQSSESLGLEPNSLSTSESIRQGCKYFSELLEYAESKKVDVRSVVQSYNFGITFIDYVANNGGKYSLDIATRFAKEKSGGEKVEYINEISISVNNGWRYEYGNMFYVLLVEQYLLPTKFDDKVFQNIMNEALKYQGWKYVFGGASPTTSFDCSGLTQWTYGTVGIKLPRTAQMQYNATSHISLAEAKAGDLVFFHSTYNAGEYITHVGIYLGDNKMYHAGDPIGYANLLDTYWQQHLVGAGRIK